MAVDVVETARLVLGARSLTGDAGRRFGRPATGWERGVLRFLGARQAVQALVVSRTGWHALSAAVDVLHGSSMLLLLAAAPRRYGRAARGQALTAAALIAMELLASRRD